MILVSFHGGSSGITNIYAYTTTPPTKNLTHSALSITAKDAELRALVVQNGFFYVADGAKSASVVSFFTPVQGTPYNFDNPSTFIAATMRNDNFTTAISHPYSIAFDSASNAYIANQDTNVLALVTVNKNGAGTLNKGCQSSYLNGLFPKGMFLDGTFAGSQVGSLPNVGVTATDIPPSNGGLTIWPTSGKIQHSVRDVFVNGETLLVCDEAGSCIRIYSLPNGDYLNALCGLGPNLPTHLQIFNGGLYVSAGDALYWMPLPDSKVGTPSAPFVNILTPPKKQRKIAGIAFGSEMMYVALQANPQGGEIYSYNLVQASPTTAPTLTDETVYIDSKLDSKFTDTPEFLLYLPDPPQ